MTSQPRAPAALSPRTLLRRLREAMARPAGTETKLGEIVRIIAAGMVAEVCSIYLLRAGDVLELFATEGLKPEAVHVTRLKVGEGLIGTIAASAKPLALADAQSHPKFAYRPETGEEIYHSLAGVPILRGGKIAGVLAVQNRTKRQYTEEEIEALETIAMVLAELFGSYQLIAAEEMARIERAWHLPQRFDGRTLAEGLAIGRAVLHEPKLTLVKTIAEDPAGEKRRLEDAFAAMRDSVDRLLAAPEIAGGGETREILEAYRMFATDTGWMVKLQAVVDAGFTAEAAVQRVQIETRHRMQAVTDPYLRERLADLEDLANRLLRHLIGIQSSGQAEALPEEAVIVARNMGPAELLDFDRARLRAVVLEGGTAQSHVAIVARALNVPLIGGINGITQATEPGDRIIVDGENGQVFVRPSQDVLRAFGQSLAARQARVAEYAALRDDPPVTRDGRRITLYLNAGLLIDMAQLEETGAEGVGLYRTELHFMVRSRFPRIEEQRELYTRVLSQAGDKPVVFRTLDVGGDKALPYLRESAEENPAIGWRAIRIALDRPALLKSQVRALLQAAAGRRLCLMFPMVAEVDEFLRARELVNQEVERQRALNRLLPAKIEVGTMLEVPALVWQLPALLARVDFVSIGSNDLLQFLFSADRNNARLADRYESLSPPVLNCLREIVRSCDRLKVPLTLCGEMAGRPLEAMALIGLGFRRLSMPAGAIGPVKAMLRSLDVGQLEKFLADLYERPDHSLRRQLARFARDQGVQI
jgi:phosphotransferase system enzyme I (PtsP)